MESYSQSTVTLFYCVILFATELTSCLYSCFFLCGDNNIKILTLKNDYHESGAFRPKVEHCDHGVPKCGCIATSRLEHCDFAIGVLRLGSRGIATGAFRQRGIPTILHYMHCLVWVL